MMITGKPPYDGVDNKDTVMNIKTDKPNMEISEIENVSRPCRDLIRKLLERNFHLRFSAKEALEHPWIKKNYARSMGINKHMMQALMNMQDYYEQN